MKKGDSFIVNDGPFYGCSAVVVTVKEFPEGHILYECDITLFDKVHRIVLTQNDLPKSKDYLNGLVDGLSKYELRTLRAIINGKLSKRKITPEH